MSRMKRALLKSGDGRSYLCQSEYPSRAAPEHTPLAADARARAATRPAARRVLETAPAAPPALGRANGIEERGLLLLSSATETGLGDVQALAGFIVERRIPAMFVESSVPPRTIEAVQAAVRSRGFDVQIGGQLYSDAMGRAGTEDGTYPGMVRHNIRTIVEALQ